MADNVASGLSPNLYVMFAVCKKRGKIIAVYLVNLSNFTTCAKVALEDVIRNKYNVINAEFIRRPDGSINVHGLQGQISRYPVYNADGMATVSRPLVVVGKFPHGKDKTSYFLVINCYGQMARMSNADLVSVCESSTIANAYAKFMNILPIPCKSLKNTSETKSREFVLLSSAQFGTDRAVMTQIMSAEQLKIPANNMAAVTEMLRNRAKAADEVVLTEADFKKLRDLYFCLTDSRFSKFLRNEKDAFTEEDVQLLHKLYNRAAIWGSLPKLLYNRMKAMFAAFKIDMDAVTSELKLTNDDLYNSDAFKDMLGTSEDPLTQMVQRYTYAHLKQAAKNMYTAALKAELTTTPLLKEAIGEFGHFEGFEHRIKAPLSFKEKVYERSRLEEQTSEQALRDIKDLLRYTIILDGPTKSYVAGTAPEACDKYAETANKVILSLTTGDITAGVTGYGMQLLKGKNYWLNKNNPYQGLNLCFFTSAGIASNATEVRFELQVHTEQSHEAKSGDMHSFYEESRSASTTQSRRDELNKKMWAIANAVPVPYNVEAIVCSPDALAGYSGKSETDSLIQRTNKPIDAAKPTVDMQTAISRAMRRREERAKSAKAIVPITSMETFIASLRESKQQMTLEQFEFLARTTDPRAQEWLDGRYKPANAPRYKYDNKTGD